MLWQLLEQSFFFQSGSHGSLGSGSLSISISGILDSYPHLLAANKTVLTWFK